MSFHFGQEVADSFLNKFNKFYPLLTKLGDKNYIPSKLELSYGFNEKRDPVIFQIWSTEFRKNGEEKRVRIFEDLTGEEIGLDYALNHIKEVSKPDNDIEVLIFYFFKSNFSIEIDL